MAAFASIALRLGLGIMFAAHGLQKAFGLFDGPGVKGFSQMLAGMGFAPPVFWAALAAYTELLGGICLVIGLGTRIAAAALFILIVTAGINVHLKNGFFLAKGGFEYVFVIACACLALIFLGGGRFSVTPKF